MIYLNIKKMLNIFIHVLSIFHEYRFVYLASLHDSLGYGTME